MLANLPNKGFYGAIIDDEIGKSLEFCHLTKMDKYHNIWMKSFPNELSHLEKGISDVPGIYTIDFIPQEEVPFGTTVTYGRIVCTYCPQKIEKHRTRLTVGGNMFICLYYVSDPTSDMTTAKMLFNSVISTPGECFITIDLKTSTSKPLCPNQGTRRQRLISYRMRSLKNTTCVTFSTTSMFISKSIWVCMEFMQQESWPTSSSRRDSTSMANINVNSPLASTVMCGAPSCSAWLLMIFGVKFQGIEHAKHLKEALEKYYKVAVDWEGRLFFGITLDWNYNMKKFGLSVPGYVQRKRTK